MSFFLHLFALKFIILLLLLLPFSFWPAWVSSKSEHTKKCASKLLKLTLRSLSHFHVDPRNPAAAANNLVRFFLFYYFSIVCPLFAIVLKYNSNLMCDLRFVQSSQFVLNEDANVTWRCPTAQTLAKAEEIAKEFITEAQERIRLATDETQKLHTRRANAIDGLKMMRAVLRGASLVCSVLI
jgi:hypothetical protein